MIRCAIFPFAVLVPWFCACLTRAEDTVIQGRILDASGEGVPHADLSPFWRANGSPLRADGTTYDLNDRAQASKFWARIGDMQPWRPGTSTDAKGNFTLDTAGSQQFIVMDKQRRHGAVYRCGTAHGRSDIEIELAPLTTVKARLRIKGSNESPVWSHVYVNLERDPNYPLANPRVVSCGSESQEFEFRLPEGAYNLDVYAISGQQPENIDLRVFPNQKLIVDGNGGTVDLGVLELEEDLPDRKDLERESKKAGRWRDYTEHYGELSPNWHAVDARGFDVQSNIVELRGKWVLLEFWGLSCRPCLSQHMPAMIEFYNRHANLHDQFEVVGVCIDFTGELASIQDLDAALQPIIDKVWQGNRIPFPIVLDNTFHTWERFGIPGLGTSVLIDPDGRVVAGGIDQLRRALKIDGPSDQSSSP